MPKYTLITGCAGFVGSHITQHFLERGKKVIGIDNLSTGNSNNIPLGIDFIRGDISDSEFVDSVFNNYDIDRIYHCAAFASESLSHYARGACYTTNIIGTNNLITCSIRSKRVDLFVFTSSVAVYGHKSIKTIEEHECQPIDPYGVSKLCSEYDLRTAHLHHGLNYQIVRLHNLYGPNQNLEDRFRNVVGIFIRKCIDKMPIPIVADGKQCRQFTFIDDAIKIIGELSDRTNSWNNIFNVGASEYLTIIELANLVSGYFPTTPDFIHLAPRDEAFLCEVSHGKVNKALGYAPILTPISDGLEKTLAWAMQTEYGSLQELYHTDIRFDSNNWSK